MAKKRAFGEGTIYENKKRDRWEGQFSYLDSATGKTKRKLITGRTQKQVSVKGKKFLQDIENGLLPDADKITIWQWLDCWLIDYIKPNVRTKSFEKYESCLNNYIRPTIGHIGITKIKAPDIQRVFNDMLASGGKAKTGLSTSTVRATRRYLSMAFSKAVQVGILAKNVVQVTDAPRLVKEEIRPLTEEQATILLQTAKEGEYFYWGVKQRRKSSEGNEYHKAMAYMVVSLALSTGMRLGEVFGLKWKDIDFPNNTLNVQRALVSSNTKGMIFEDPKTKGSKRRILVTVSTKEALERYQKEQKWFADFLGDKFDNEEKLLFTNLWGKPVDTSNFTTRYFKKMLMQAELDKEFSFHDLRHTHATLLLRQGINIKVISERLGHSTVAMTLDTYSHLMPDMQETAVKALEGMFDIE
ncbi:tyrosine-type recombinase/integrase [Pelosinus propionicus]|uniref:Phage integrase, N-terminal SAM-like domain n=1 Tax=Pelosinus propionicus DSM 13327 TaxID=1123291 RepID=A0A1I4HNK1_9FIRM|nr:tyrosine-type recombinase/integrase [Pelosinus propionicus]SFL43868.1 Phage integrase, N-terminal SAM-like domain [Pelosinus propionicus DSM 13327]